MQQTSEIQLSPRKLKKFIKHLCLASKVIEERDIAKKNLSEHIKSLKKHVKGKQVAKTLKELEDRINFTIEKEKKAAKIHHHEPFHHEQLREKMQQLDSKLKTFTESYAERKKRIQELEKKITGKDSKQNIIAEIKETVAKLEKKYKELVKKHDKEYMEKIKEKIQALKSKLEKL